MEVLTAREELRDAFEAGDNELTLKALYKYVDMLLAVEEQFEPALESLQALLRFSFMMRDASLVKDALIRIGELYSQFDDLDSICISLQLFRAGCFHEVPWGVRSLQQLVEHRPLSLEKASPRVVCGISELLVSLAWRISRGNLVSLRPQIEAVCVLLLDTLKQRLEELQSDVRDKKTLAECPDTVPASLLLLSVARICELESLTSRAEAVLESAVRLFQDDGVYRDERALLRLMRSTELQSSSGYNADPVWIGFPKDPTDLFILLVEAFAQQLSQKNRLKLTQQLTKFQRPPRQILLLRHVSGSRCCLEELIARLPEVRLPMTVLAPEYDVQPYLLYHKVLRRARPKPATPKMTQAMTQAMDICPIDLDDESDDL